MLCDGVLDFVTEGEADSEGDTVEEGDSDGEIVDDGVSEGISGSYDT